MLIQLQEKCETRTKCRDGVGLVDLDHAPLYLGSENLADRGTEADVDEVQLLRPGNPDYLL